MLNGGAQRQLVRLVSRQVIEGTEAHVALLDGGALEEDLRASGAKLHWVKSFGYHDPLLLWRLVLLIRRVEPDIVQTWINLMDVMGGLAAVLAGKPWILSERSSERNYPRSLKNALRAWLGGRFAVIVSNSAGGDAYWSRWIGDIRRRHVIPNAVPIVEIDATQPVVNEEAKPQRDRKLVLYVGRMSPEKNLRNLLGGLRLANRAVPLQAVFFGDGTHVNWVNEEAQRERVEDLVRQKGYQPNVWSWMKRADVFVSVSRHEGSPNAVLEAIACKCPVVLSDIPAHRELASPEAAVFVDPDSADSIAEGLVRSLSDRQMAHRRAEEARSKATLPIIEDITHRYSEVYRAVLETARGRARG